MKKMTIEIVDLPVKNCDFPKYNYEIPSGKRLHNDGKIHHFK